MLNRRSISVLLHSACLFMEADISLAQVTLTWGGGCSPPGHNCFQPLVSGGNSVVLQRKGASCGGVRSKALPSSGSQLYCSGFFGQLDLLGLPSQTGGHSISGPQFHCAEDPPLGGDDRISPDPSVLSGQEQGCGGSPVSPKPVSSWLELLGVLSFMIQLVPGGLLRVRSLQLILRRSWDRCDQSRVTRWTPGGRRDLEWWLVCSRLEEGVSLAQVSLQLDLWSNNSDVGWGAHRGEDVTFGLWSLEEAVLSINARDLLAVEYSLWFFAPQFTNSTVALFVDNSTVITSQPGRHAVPTPQLHRPAQPQMGKVDSGGVSFAIYNGTEQCASRFPSPGPISF